MKIIKQFTYALMAIAVVLTGCKDDFSDEDFYNLQKQAAEAAAAQLQTDITTLSQFNFIVDVSGAPSSGLDVTMTPLDVNVGTVFTGTTGSNGEVSFTDVPTGTSVIEISGAEIVTTRVIIFFNNNSTVNNGGQTVVIQRAESAAVEVFSTNFSTSGATAIIRGNVTAELDLTNSTPEIPSNLTISANFYEDLVISNPQSGSIRSVTIVGQGDFGSSAVDSVGNYSMVVPVTELDNSTNTTPRPVELLIPSFTADQMVAFTRRDGVDVGPTMEAIETGFGPNYAPNPIPEVPGLMASFPAPPVATGAGFALTLAPLGTRLGSWTTGGDFTQNVAGSGDTTMVSYEFNFDDPGSEYMRSPDVTLSGGGATVQQKMYASLEGLFNSVTTDGGTGYTAADVVTLTFSMWAVNFADDMDTVLITVNNSGNTITADGAGALPTTVDFSAFTGPGFDTDFDTDFINGTYGYRVMRFEVAFAGGTGTATGAATALSEVSGLRLVNDATQPTYYTSAPTITFSGGTSPVAATMQASASITNFRTYFTVTPDNSGNTAPYNTMPTSVDIKYEDGYARNSSGGTFVDDDVTTQDDIYIGMNTDISNIYNFGQGTGSVTILNNLMIDGSGDLVWMDPNYAAITYYMGGPTTYDHVGVIGSNDMAEADFWNDGSNTYIDPDTGEIVDMNVPNSGSGYTSIFNLTLMFPFPGLPGTGADIQLTASSGGQWDGSFSILNGGSGYLPNVNQASYNSSSLPNSIDVDVRPGGVYVRNLDYGTGERFVNVEGFEGN